MCLSNTQKGWKIRQGFDFHIRLRRQALPALAEAVDPGNAQTRIGRTHGIPGVCREENDLLCLKIQAIVGQPVDSRVRFVNAHLFDRENPVDQIREPLLLTAAASMAGVPLERMTSCGPPAFSFFQGPLDVGIAVQCKIGIDMSFLRSGPLWRLRRGRNPAHPA